MANKIDSVSYSFSLLPGEVKNKSYRLTLVMVRPLYVRALYPDQYVLDKEDVLCKRRTTFNYACGTKFWLLGMPCKATTYSLHRRGPLDSPLIFMLTLNHQNRKEAVSIFYGESAFRFDESVLLLRFLTDRTPEARRCITFFELAPNVDFLSPKSLANHKSTVALIVRKQAFNALGKLEHPKLKGLVLSLKGFDPKLS